MKTPRLLRYFHERFFPERSEGYPDTFIEELNIQSMRFLLPLSFISIVAWLPYIHLDLTLHPEEPFIIVLRAGLSVMGLLMVILQFHAKIQHRSILLLFILGAYVEISCAVITALSGSEMNYIGGYLFLLMLVPLVPISKGGQIFMLTASVATFFTIGLLHKGIRFDSVTKLYILNDIIATTLVALFFIYVLSAMRYRSWQKSKWIETQRSELQGVNSELVKKTDRIVMQQREIEIRNKILETELSLAKQIQKQLIPSKYQDDNISSLYKPMEMVGGDFFDIIRFRDTNQIGIFISDVSGHGVPAAFITAIIKSFILNSGVYKIDPSKLLLFLNDVLINLAGGNFITAFYGIYNYRTKKFMYANAGHNFPILMSGDPIEPLTGSSGPPLALWSNVELQKMRKTYHTHELKLPREMKILFYTDGLTEAVNPASTKEMYGDVLFINELYKIREHNPDTIVNRLYRSLVDFRGNDNFEDDVCIICFATEKKKEKK